MSSARQYGRVAKRVSKRRETSNGSRKGDGETLINQAAAIQSEDPQSSLVDASPPLHPSSKRKSRLPKGTEGAKSVGQPRKRARTQERMKELESEVIHPVHDSGTPIPRADTQIPSIPPSFKDGTLSSSRVDGSPRGSKIEISLPLLSTPVKKKTGSVLPESPTTSPYECSPIETVPSSRAPKDLSFLFPSTPHAPIRSPTKLGFAKRMLSRSRTDGSFTSSHSNHSMSLSPSSTPSRTASLPLLTNKLPLQSPPGVSTLAAVRASQRTYSHSRSFLVEIPGPGPAVDAHLGDITIGLEHELHKESYSDLRVRWGVDDSEDSTILGPSVNELKSITEMRSKGENRRLWDEIKYLFEGLADGSSLGVKRASAVEIIRKMGDSDFVRKAKSADFFGRSWRGLREAGAGSGIDAILDACLAIFCAIVSRDAREADELSTYDAFLDVMTQFLCTQRDCDPLLSGEGDDVEQQLGFSKLERILLTDLRALVRNHPSLLLPASSMSIRALSSRSLSAISQVALSPYASLIPPLLSSLLAELALVPQRISLFAAGGTLIDASQRGSPDLEHIDHCLRVLECYLSKQDAPEEHKLIDTHVQALVEGVLALSLACLSVLQNGNPGNYNNDMAASRCLETALRVLVNVTNYGIIWCKALTNVPHSMICLLRVIIFSHADRLADSLTSRGTLQEMDDANVHTFDRLCLAVALLTNLVHSNNETKSRVLQTTLNPDCSGNRGCILVCRCKQQVSAFECLARIYKQEPESENDLVEAENSFLRGHIAVLLGILLLFDETRHPVIFDCLPGNSTRSKLDSLINSIVEFGRFYAEITTRASHLLGQTNQAQPVVHETVAGWNRGTEGGAEIASHVADALERLRDKVH